MAIDNAYTQGPDVASRAKLPARLTIEQGNRMNAVHVIAGLETLYGRHGNGFIKPRGRDVLTRAIEDGRVLRVTDETGETIAAACIFDLAGKVFEFGGQCSSLPGFGLQRLLVQASLALELHRRTSMSQVIAVVDRANHASSYNLIKCGFRRAAPQPCFIDVSGVSAQRLANQVDCFRIKHADAGAQAAALRQAVQSGHVVSPSAGVTLPIAWQVGFLPGNDNKKPGVAGPATAALV
jgi:hypothetical protein